MEVSLHVYALLYSNSQLNSIEYVTV